MNKRVLIVAGEASGDLHGARLLRELRSQVGELDLYGLGGEGMRAQGVDLIADVSTISVIGLAEVARVLPRARKIFREVVTRAKAEPPDVAVLIDFPEFNLRLAPVLSELGIKVVYYVSPQVWAWRKGRVKSMARCVDRMLVFFPFEEAFYRGRVDVIHVGHPLVDEVPSRPQVWDSKGEQKPLKVVLLPGSRSSEVKRLLPVLLPAVRELKRVRDALQVVLVEASTVRAGVIERILEDSGVEVERVPEADRFEAIASAHLALCASGTATLEVGLLRTPMIVVYRIGFFSYWLGRIVVKVPFISLVNLVLGKAAVPELIQSEATADKIAAEALDLLGKEARRETMRAELGGLRHALGESGAAARAAAEVASFLGGGTA